MTRPDRAHDPANLRRIAELLWTRAEYLRTQGRICAAIWTAARAEWYAAKAARAQDRRTNERQETE